MKNIYFFLITLCLLSAIVQAQTPNKFNYQAVARDANGAIITLIDVRFTVLNGSVSGTEVYKEEHLAVDPDDHGVFSLQIGGGSVLNGSWGNINWGSGAKFLKVEIQKGTGGFTQMGTPQELVSVPYAQVAQVSLTDKDQQTLAVSGHTLSIANGNNITLPDEDKQTLALNGTSLSISNGNSVSLPAIPPQLWASSGNNISNSNNGNVGIKTTNPLAPLHIKSDGVGGVGGVQLLLEENNSGDGARLQFKNSNPTQYWDIWGYTNPDEPSSRMNFNYNNGTLGHDILTLTGDGRVGINTSSPYPVATMEVLNPNGIGNLFVSSGGTSGSEISLVNWVAGAQHWYLTGGANLFTIANLNGKMIDANNSFFEPWYDNSLDLGSSAYRWKAVWATNPFIQTSDARLKTNIQPLASGLEQVMQLKPVRYDWKEGRSLNGKNSLGFLAQDVEKVVPEAVIHEQASPEQVESWKNAGKQIPEMLDTYGMQYEVLIPVLTRAIQEQQSQIEMMNNTIAQLMKQVQLLETKAPPSKN